MDYHQLTLPISQLQPNPFQPRDKIKKEDLEELIKSIKTYGILEPLVIAKTPAGYQIIAGERRWRAAKLAGLKEVPVHVKKTSPRGMLEMALVENVQRLDLNSIERAQAFRQLIRDFKFTVTELSDKIGKSPSYISNSLKLLDLPDAVKDGLIGQQITEGHARALAGIDDERIMINCFKIILKEGASVRRAEELARRFRHGLKQENRSSGKAMHIDDDLIQTWEKKAKSYFNAPVKLKLSRSRNQTRVSITLKGAPDVTQADLETIMKWTEVSKQ